MARGNKLAAEGRYLPPGGKEHDLPALARQASLGTTPEEETLLRYMARYIAQGRYPVQKRSPEEYLVLADGTRRLSTWSPRDEAEYKALDERIQTEVVRLAAEPGHA